jgi:hypothetical protein
MREIRRNHAMISKRVERGKGKEEEEEKEKGWKTLV